MATPRLIQKAAKNYPAQGIKKGEPYWRWSFRFGGVHRSKTPPKPSQLTQSPFLSKAYELREMIAETEVSDKTDLQSLIEDLTNNAEDLLSETQEKLENMPEGLQEGDTGQLLQDRIQAVEEFISSLEEIKSEVEDGPDEGDAEEDWMETKLENLRGIDLEV